MRRGHGFGRHLERGDGDAPCEGYYTTHRPDRRWPVNEVNEVNLVLVTDRIDLIDKVDEAGRSMKSMKSTSSSPPSSGTGPLSHRQANFARLATHTPVPDDLHPVRLMIWLLAHSIPAPSDLSDESDQSDLSDKKAGADPLTWEKNRKSGHHKNRHPASHRIAPPI
jgi:hypothetical protein